MSIRTGDEYAIRVVEHKELLKANPVVHDIAGGVRIRALSSNEVQYTYQSCESDAGILEYYETWDEAAFPDMYRGGASLSRNG